jgi:hypothetical protein
MGKTGLEIFEIYELAEERHGVRRGCDWILRRSGSRNNAVRAAMSPPRASKKTLTLSGKDYEAQWFICGKVQQFSREIMKTLPITQRKYVFL